MEQTRGFISNSPEITLMALLHFHFHSHSPSPAIPAHWLHPPLLLQHNPSNSQLLTGSPHLNRGVRSPISTRPLPQRASQTAARVSLSENQAQASVSPPTSDGDGDSPSVQMLSASEVVRSFYGGINRRDLPSVEFLIAENCVYEDLVFPRPFVGRKVPPPSIDLAF